MRFDRQTFKVVEIDDIIVSDIKLNRPTDIFVWNLLLSLLYYVIIADTTDKLYRIHKTAEKDELCWYFR